MDVDPDEVLKQRVKKNQFEQWRSYTDFIDNAKKQDNQVKRASKTPQTDRLVSNIAFHSLIKKI